MVRALVGDSTMTSVDIVSGAGYIAVNTAYRTLKWRMNGLQKLLKGCKPIRLD
jgi:hypothetical protein